MGITFKQKATEGKMAMTAFEIAYGKYRRSVWFSRFFCIAALAMAVGLAIFEYQVGNY